MNSLTKLVSATSIAVWAMLAASSAHAATYTLDFDDPVPAPLILDPDSPGIVNGNCESNATRPCLGVNSQGEPVLTIEPPATFSITSFWFDLLGEADDMLVTTSKGALTLFESLYPHNSGGQVIDVSMNSIFQNITSLSFLMNTGNGRVDDIVVTVNQPAPIPLPGAGLLLLGAVGGLAGLRRRNRAA